MNTNDFDFLLPERLIAQTPIKDRDHSRMLVVDRITGKTEHKHFFNIIDYLKSGDLLILNNSKVIPARIFGKNTDNGYIIETLLLKQIENNRWEALVKPGKKAKIGYSFDYGESLKGTIVDIKEDGNRVFDFSFDGENIYEVLDKVGNMPLPPYITETLKNKDRYQTVYAKDLGSAAAPTAGLHFTKKLLDELSEKGVIIKYVTLHVGLGTFRSVKVDNITDHKMHSESFYVPDDTANEITKAKMDGRRVFCVGTTSVRTVESAFDSNFKIEKNAGETDIFIYPGYNFKIVDGLITNFHLPKSTLIMLVSAFAGRENILRAYQTAIDNEYRFFSFGDAMLIL